MKAAYEDNFLSAYCGDALEVMRGLPAGSVHCSVTSPPYWALRSYLPDDHPKKKAELGLERTPAEYVERMVKYFRGVKRLLRKDGTLWVVIGDTYASFKGACNNPGGGEKSMGKHLKAADVIPKHRASPNRMLPRGHGGLKPKDMVGIPWMVAFALRADGWYLRSEIIWNKPNPMPESVTDRPTKSHETIFLLSISPRYYYDAEAIKEEVTGNAHDRGNGVNPKAQKVPEGWNTGPGGHDGKAGRYGAKQNPSFSGSVTNPVSRRNKRSVWTVATQPYPGAHYATFPPKLILPCILAGTSERGCCPKCGAPWRRLVESKKHFESGSGKSGNPIAGKNDPDCQGGGDTGDIRKGPVLDTKTVGWEAGCKCGEEAEPCVVLDPFAGSGTTGQVARELGRKAILIELNPEDIELRMKERFKQELLEL